MRASTHTELYRPFEGELRRRGPRFAPMFRADFEVATRRKLPLLLFFAPPAITGIIFSFLVYAKFTGQGPIDDLSPAQMVAMTLAQRMIEVNAQISTAASTSRAFALLVIAWFGAGLIADDRRVGAHLLYFSRPLTRLDYYLGHFCTVAFFGLCAVLGPGLLICTVAVFSSPEYAFLKEHWDVVLATNGHAFLYVGSLSALVLAVSSLAPKKSFALAAIFGLVVGSQAVSEMGAELLRDRDLRMISLWMNYEKVGAWMLDVRLRGTPWDPGWSLLIVVLVGLLSFAVAMRRISKLEVVA